MLDEKRDGGGKDAVQDVDANSEKSYVIVVTFFQMEVFYAIT
jgi:hypothetical protein